MADINGTISDVAAAVTAAEAKYESLPVVDPVPEETGGEETGEETEVTGGETDGNETDGATSLTTFATIVVASVFTLAV